MSEFNPNLSFPGPSYIQVRNVFNVIYSAAIAYNFDLIQPTHGRAWWTPKPQGGGYSEINSIPQPAKAGCGALPYQIARMEMASNGASAAVIELDTSADGWAPASLFGL
jgi:hypothetical protein